jgi:hypothetical protein
MGFIEQANAIIEKETERRKQLQESATPTIKALFTAFFEEMTTINRVAWTQYTPYFNDGSECVFSVHEPHFELVDEPMDDDDSFYDWHDYYSFRDKQPALYAATGALYDAMQAMEDEFRLAFGDHARVIADRNGFNVEREHHD